MENKQGLFYALMTASKGRLKSTQDYKEAVRNSQVTFLAVPTPSQADGAIGWG